MKKRIYLTFVLIYKELSKELQNRAGINKQLDELVNFTDSQNLKVAIYEKVYKAKDKEAAKAYMDCYETVHQYLCKLYKKQTNIDPNDVSGMFEQVELLEKLN